PGVVGGNMEAFSADPRTPLFEIEHAVARIKAARAAADASGIPFTLTARTDVYISGQEKPMSEAVRRARRYREAGADCIFVAGVTDKSTIAALVREIGGPMAIGVGGGQQPLTAPRPASQGGQRVSIGGSLARATFALIRRAATEMAQEGTFSFASEQIPDAELSTFFGSWNEKVA